jgi:type II secretory pathway component PulM
MSVEAQPGKDGRMHFSLGPVERWIAVVIGGAIVAVGYWLVSSMQTVLTQQAVANQQLQTIGAQLTDVPQLRRDVVELRVQVKAHDEAIKELRQTRGLK